MSKTLLENSISSVEGLIDEMDLALATLRGSVDDINSELHDLTVINGLINDLRSGNIVSLMSQYQAYRDLRDKIRDGDIDSAIADLIEEAIGG